MFGFILIILAIMGVGLALTFTSDTFAYVVSRHVEAARDAIEYRLALRAQRHDDEDTRGARFARAASYSQAA